MASFAQLIGRLQAEQKLQSNINRSSLGIDVEEEKIDLEEARSDYRDQVEEAQRKMAKNARSRSRRGLLGSVLGAALSFTPLGAVGGALVGGLASSLSRSRVKPYSQAISSNLPGGKFHAQARKDFSRDIESTNQFISDAAEGQNLLNMTNALNDAYNIYGFQNAYGEDIRGFFQDRKERKLFGGPVSLSKRNLGYTDSESLINNYNTQGMGA
jgi:hypothetical protein|tara:strand:- start:235 stop:873 length:639 start_codon:yes stop_codon:yes gene_type:complete